MKKIKEFIHRIMYYLWNETGFPMRTKLIIVFLVVNIIPLILMTIIAWRQFSVLTDLLSGIAANETSQALNGIATQNIERMTTDTAKTVADFLYARDSDILYLSKIAPSEENYRSFIQSRTGRLTAKNQWVLAADGKSWVCVDPFVPDDSQGLSTNPENNDMDKYNYRQPTGFKYDTVPLYDEITYIDLDGNELVKVVSSPSAKIHYPMSTEKKNVSIRENTYVKAETYFSELSKLKPNDIYVSDVIGAYVGSNYIGMYVPETVEAAAKTRGYDIPYDPEDQAYAGKENPNGQRFEGIIRWATPVTDSSGKITGYVTFALNHDHLMELVDHITPMDERYTEMPSAFEGNYAFIWDYKCRSICHPRHNSIVGYDPQTGEPQVPWLESSIYDAWQKSGVKNWNDFIIGWPEFDSQSRKKVPAPALTKAGLVGLDGRYLNNAPQCTGWMDLTKDGGSGSFYILWSGLYKLTTAAAIPYYTGQYAPSASNNFSKRGFGIVTIGAGLDDFTQPAQKIGVQLHDSMGNNLTNTLLKSLLTLVITVILVTLIAIRIASFLTESISKLISGMSRFRAGERQFRFNLLVQDEFGTLAEAFNMMADNIENSESGPLTIIGMDYRVIYMNEQGLALLNATLKNTIGRPYSEVSLYPQGSKYDPIIALQNSAEAEALYHDTSRRYFKGLANYFLDKNGNKIGYIISSVDVTEIQAAVKAADQASRAKGDFLSNMSHEIRTPLNAIIGMTSMGISATELNRKDYCLGKIHEASRHLLGVINDILDMSKIEANKLELSPVKFVFEKMLQRVIDVIGFRIGEKEQHLNIDVDKNIPLVIIADEQWFAQVITNLLSNANKFTPRGGTIRLDAVLLEENDGVCTIEVKVTDTGIGISEEQIPKLFKVFEQAERSTSRKFGGTGLGLAISKRIVEMMDGEIKVESQPGKGSVFSFFIKARRGEETRESLLSPGVNWRNVRILAIDDDPVVQEYFKSIGEQLNLTYDVAGSGREALDMITKNGQYDLYFVDWNMPGMNGIELSKQINKDMNNKHVIVMISSIEWVVIEAEAREVGVSRFIQKPLFISAIADCINEVLGKPTEPVKALVDSFEDRCVLLAEDVEINREIVIALLEPTKLKIDCAENGAEAVKLFSGSPEKYDMIFMDVQMPEVDGYEATRRIRAMEIPKAKSIPIIAMTANVFREDIEQCLAVGMNDHIGKPLNFDEVMTKLRRYLSK